MRLLVTIAIVLGPFVLPPGAHAAWLWPVEGEVITAYRNGDDPYAGGQHRGIDIAASAGTVVRAPAAGSVTFAGTAGSSGLTVSMRTADGRFDTSYLHLSGVAVAKGDRVAAGTRLGSVGTSGRRSATQPHLHFGVREAGSRHAYRDPLALLPPPQRGPVREAPRAVPVAAPAPVRAAPRRERVPRAAPVQRRVPGGRRVRVPGARRLPRAAPARPALPGVPALRTRPVAPLSAPAPTRMPEPAPRLGSQPIAQPADAPEPARTRPATPSAEPAGPDLGMALACAGLLLAAACLGVRGRGASAGERDPSLSRWLRPLGGRR